MANIPWDHIEKSGKQQQDKWLAEIQRALIGGITPMAVTAQQAGVQGRGYKGTLTGSCGKRMIRSRLHLFDDSGPVPFDFLEVVQMANRVVVFIAHNDQAIQVEDNLDLFPSDALITQLRLLMNPKTD